MYEISRVYIDLHTETCFRSSHCQYFMKVFVLTVYSSVSPWVKYIVGTLTWGTLADEIYQVIVLPTSE